MSEEKTVEKHLFVIRHAESTSNANPADQTPNPGLTENGKSQASKVQGPVDLLIVSPMKRTMQTYAHSALKVKRLLTSDLFREWMVYGPSSQLDLEPARTESAADLRKRIVAASKFIAQQPERTVALLSHGVFLAELAKHLGKPLASALQNAQVADLGRVQLPK